MLRLPPVFSSGALFLHSAPLTVSGYTDPHIPAGLALYDSEGRITASVRTVSDENGTFSLTLQTPPASLSEWTLTVTAGEESHVMHNVLFGALWLASGQSNMELQNAKQPDADAYLPILTGKVVRVYHVYNTEGGSSGAFPDRPLDDAAGAWFDCADAKALGLISAIGTSFSAELYDFLRKVGNETPVGFVNACWGGTSIRAWIPRTALDADPALTARLQAHGHIPTPGQWNTFGHNNAAQICCQYNLKIHGLLGLRFRGMLWYQGEFDCWDEPYQRLYADCLSLLYRTYRDLFSPDGDFPMLCVLLYPFPCTDAGDCYIGYVNQNFVDAARENPDCIHFMPISDLPPVWNFPVDHPIHPLHKFRVGRRLAAQAEAVVYGRDGQKNPAVLDRYEINGSRLILHFTVPGQPDALQRFGGIRIGEAMLTDPARNGRPIGLYIADASGTYVPADCEILSCDTVAISHPGIAHPLHAAYGCNSMEEGCNLWAGDYPVGCFRTDDLSQESDANRTLIEIQCKPWCDPAREAVWTCESGPVTDVFYRPTWKPSDGCELVRDRAFTLGGGSIRLARPTPAKPPYDVSLGAYVERHPYNRLDFDRYSALHLRMLTAAHTVLSMVLTYEDADKTVRQTELPAEKIRDLHHSWAEYRIPFENLPAGEILRMELRAVLSHTYYPFVNFEGFVLMPR